MKEVAALVRNNDSWDALVAWLEKEERHHYNTIVVTDDDKIIHESRGALKQIRQLKRLKERYAEYAKSATTAG